MAGDFVSGSDACRTCDLCERDNIYVLPHERMLVKHDGGSDNVPLVEFSGVAFIAKSTAYCPFYSTASHRCGIYEHRPFACRIYPLDVILHVEQGVENLWWVVHDTCPITQHLLSEGRKDFFLEWAARFERLMDDHLGEAFRRQDRAARGLEFLFRTPLKYTPIKPFVPAIEG